MVSLIVEEVHVHDQVAGEKLAGGFGLLAALDFLDALGRDEDLIDKVPHLFGLDAAVDVFLHLPLLAGEDMHDKPLVFRG